ncbi:MAG: amino acid adenylation domain-containing protein, partial [Actinobacteria bacterium]|nr:amino acid adenylation domain-containing protein [Actinomycetota bacterium]
AFLYLDPTYPPERLEYMIDDAQVAVVLADEQSTGVVPAGSAPVMPIAAEMTEEVSDGAPTGCRSGPRNLAYVVYTSGSTGAPKGVLVEHAGLVNVIRSQIEGFEITRASRVLQMLPLSFDAALGEIFRALAAGATLVLAEKESLLPGPDLVDLLREERITAVAMPPSALAVMPAVGVDLPALRTLTVGGASCSVELVERWRTGRRLVNGYGPTETTIAATMAVDWPPHQKPPLGRPLPGVSVYVLDRDMQPTPVGVPGELYIGGIGVARGYIRQPALTAELFPPDPFGGRPGSRLYRTGDRVRWLVDGTLEFIGRVDQQVKIRGHRVEPGEVEHVMCSHAQVQQCVVDVRELGGTPQLVAYVTLNGENAPSSPELRSFLRERLPEFLVPAAAIVLPTLPVGPNGKVDRGALPMPTTDDRTSEGTFVAPRTELEAILARIWGEVLGLTQVGIHSNFFELGGDSILSIRVVARAAEEGLRLTAQSLFKSQTVAELAEVVEINDHPSGSQGAVTGDVPLTPVQRWFLEQELINPHHFNQWQVVPVPAGIDDQILTDALRVVIDHHDVLRARFQRTSSEWRQHIGAPSHDVPYVRIRVPAGDEFDEQSFINAVLEEHQASLRLESGPLLRLVRCDLDERPSYLVFIVHHLVIDTVSWPILMEDFRTACAHRRNGGLVRLPAKGSSFKQWAEALVEYGKSDKAGPAAEFWMSRLEAAPPCLPLDFTEGRNARKSARTIEVSLDEMQTDALVRRQSHASEAPINHVILSFMARRLCRWTDDRHVEISLERHGRDEIGADLDVTRTIGWFTTFFPVRMRIDASAPLDQVIRSVDAQIREVRETPMSYAVLRYLGPEWVRASLSRRAEPPVAFNFVGSPLAARTPAVRPVESSKTIGNGRSCPLERLVGRIRLSESTDGDRRHLIEVMGGVLNSRLVLRWSYSNNRHMAATIEQLANGVLDDLREVALRGRTSATG